MPLPVHTSTHDVTASTANLARSILVSLDQRRLTTEVNTATLALLLSTLLDLAEPRAAERAEEMQRTVRSLVAQVTTAERDRDEDRQQERGGDPPPRRAWS